MTSARRLPQFLAAFGALIFAAGLAALLGVPSTNTPGIIAIVVGAVLFSIGLVLDHERSRVGWLRSPETRLHQLFVSGSALRDELIRIQGSAYDRAAFDGRVKAWEPAFWAGLDAAIPHRAGVYRDTQPRFSYPVDNSEWERQVIQILGDRLQLLRVLLTEVPYADSE